MKVIFALYGSIFTIVLGLCFVVFAQTIDVQPTTDIYEVAATKYATSTIQSIDQVEQTEIILKRLDDIQNEQKILESWMSSIYEKVR